jgi:cadmium resistance protein CadD (predicted permease)
MRHWEIRVTGLVAMIIGALLFVWSVRWIQAEWPQIFVGLLSVFSIAMGFGLLIMPLDSSEETTSTEAPPSDTE